ncbi:MAG TPA: hypothetical protein VF588_19000 [Pyrinomonadaceae bacterium]|jgi:hypothetical protein
MRKVFAAALAAGLCLAALGMAGDAARGQDAGARARELAAFFSKAKHKVKERRGVRSELFLEMRAEPAARADVAGYTSVYESDPDYKLDLRVGTDGGAEGRGTEPSPDGSRAFTLRNARVSGAVLTGTKVYEDGSTERLEGVFATLTVRRSPTDAGETFNGLGVVFDPPKSLGGIELTKLFYGRKR